MPDESNLNDDLLSALESPPADPRSLPPACALADITVSFEEEQVLDALSVAFPAQACTVIMGPSGSGKSTLLKAAAGLAVPDRGSVEILGVDPAHASDRELEALRSRNGFVFQDGALWQNMTLYQNLALPLEYHYPDLGADAVRERVVRLARELRATTRLHLRPAQVSTGERKVVSFARAVVTNPELLFMDEPTTSVDTERVDLLIRKLRELKDRRVTIVSVTHNARIASQIADYVVVMKEGRILRFGTLKDVSRSGDPEVERILTDVLSETATYDGDILALLDPDTNAFLE
jgi:ABC-type transporter Mla maintaining outer membrane lipid asymmetry ATPase subunit MlaF